MTYASLYPFHLNISPLPIHCRVSSAASWVQDFCSIVLRWLRQRKDSTEWQQSERRKNPARLQENKKPLLPACTLFCNRNIPLLRSGGKTKGSYVVFFCLWTDNSEHWIQIHSLGFQTFHSSQPTLRSYPKIIPFFSDSSFQEEHEYDRHCSKHKLPQEAENQHTAPGHWKAPNAFHQYRYPATPVAVCALKHRLGNSSCRTHGQKHSKGLQMPEGSSCAAGSSLLLSEAPIHAHTARLTFHLRGSLKMGAHQTSVLPKLSFLRTSTDMKLGPTRPPPDEWTDEHAKFPKYRQSLQHPASESKIPQNRKSPLHSSSLCSHFSWVWEREMINGTGLFTLGSAVNEQQTITGFQLWPHSNNTEIIRDFHRCPRVVGWVLPVVWAGIRALPLVKTKAFGSPTQTVRLPKLVGRQELHLLSPLPQAAWKSPAHEISSLQHCHLPVLFFNW